MPSLKLKLMLLLATLAMSVTTAPLFSQSLRSQACTPQKGPDYRLSNLDEPNMSQHPLVFGRFIVDAIYNSDIVVVDCALRDFESYKTRSVTDDIAPLVGLKRSEYIGKVLGYSADSLVFLSSNTATPLHSLLITVGTSDLQSVFGVPNHLKSPYIANSMNGYFMPNFFSNKKNGEVQSFSGTTHNYEIYFGQKGNIELYYQKKNGGSVRTAKCTNEGRQGAKRLADTIMRSYRDVEREWYIAQCSSYCANDNIHRKNCSAFKSSYKDNYKYMDPIWK